MNPSYKTPIGCNISTHRSWWRGFRESNWAASGWKRFREGCEKKYALAKTLSHILLNGQSGLSILFREFSNIESVKKNAHLLSRYLPILKLTLKIIDNLKEIIRINGADILVEKLFFVTRGKRIWTIANWPSNCKSREYCNRNFRVGIRSHGGWQWQKKLKQKQCIHYSW